MNNVKTPSQLARERRARKALDRLNSLPGMSAVKKQVEHMVQFAKINKLREENGLKADSHSNHMLFTGNPGTGKTTAARLIGEAFAAMGLLKTDQNEIPFVEVHHADVTGALLGESEKKILAKFSEARGGVLFIDEAYAFVGKDDHPTAEKVIAVIVQQMEDMRDEIVVIAAGYPDEMEAFVRFNPGLRSRFSNTIHFPDYSASDLVKIASFICEERQYRMSDGFTFQLERRLSVERSQPGFGNARTVRNVIEQSIKRQSARVAKMKRPQRDDLMLLQEEDVEQKQRVGVSEKEKLKAAMQAMAERLQEIEMEELLS